MIAADLMWCWYIACRYARSASSILGYEPKYVRLPSIQIVAQYGLTVLSKGYTPAGKPLFLFLCVRCCVMA